MILRSNVSSKLGEAQKVTKLLSEILIIKFYKTVHFFCVASSLNLRFLMESGLRSELY